MSAGNGIVIVDKPAGWTSHDVVARMRRLAGTKRVGHAGTLDPMATGVLVLGVGRATRVLGYVTGAEKEYTATIRLGQRTVTDDTEGEVVGGASAAAMDGQALYGAAAELTGDIEQVPPQFSAVKVRGVRSYKRARQGGHTELAARPVTVPVFEIERADRAGDLLDAQVRIACSSGTYVRALARDLGERLGVGAHLATLRRIRVGAYGLDAAYTLDELARSLSMIPLGDAVAAAFPRRDVSADQARRISHGGWLDCAGYGPGPVGVFGPDGTLLALMEERGETARPLAVFSP